MQQLTKILNKLGERRIKQTETSLLKVVDAKLG